MQVYLSVDTVLVGTFPCHGQGFYDILIGKHDLGVNTDAGLVNRNSFHIEVARMLYGILNEPVYASGKGKQHITVGCSPELL